VDNSKNTVFGRKTALVLEDNREQRARYVGTLKDNNYFAEGARSVEEAIERLNQKYFALLWVDLSMDKSPGVLDEEGKKLIHRARELDDPCAVIVVTVKNESRITRDYLKDAGATDFVTKEELLEFSWGAHLTKIEKALESVTWSEKRISREFLEIYGEDGNFVFDRVRRLNPRVNAAEFNRLMRRFVEHGMPFLPKIGKPLLQADADIVHGEFWSRGWGHAVELLLASPEACDRIGDSVYRDSVPRKLGLVARRTPTPFEEFSSR
jgi:CheY-like chemotaxis protein